MVLKIIPPVGGLDAPYAQVASRLNDPYDGPYLRQRLQEIAAMSESIGPGAPATTPFPPMRNPYHGNIYTDRGPDGLPGDPAMPVTTGRVVGKAPLPDDVPLASGIDTPVEAETPVGGAGGLASVEAPITSPQAQQEGGLPLRDFLTAGALYAGNNSPPGTGLLHAINQMGIGALGANQEYLAQQADQTAARRDADRADAEFALEQAKFEEDRTQAQYERDNPKSQSTLGKLAGDLANGLITQDQFDARFNSMVNDEKTALIKNIEAMGLDPKSGEGLALMKKNIVEGGAQKLTPAQIANNTEIDAARSALEARGLTWEEAKAAAESKQDSGRDNPNYDTRVAKLITKATQRKVGEDPDFEGIHAKYNIPEAEETESALPVITPQANDRVQNGHVFREDEKGEWRAVGVIE